MTNTYSAVEDGAYIRRMYPLGAVVGEHRVSIIVEERNPHERERGG